MVTPETADFALFGHPADYDHLGDIFVHSKPDFSLEKLQKYKPTLMKFFEWTPSYVSKAPLRIDLPDGRRLVGRLIICTFLPEWVTSPRQMLSASKKTVEACKLAQDLGARVVGLGGFTSIVGGAQGADLSERFGLPMTSGNSLTAAIAVAQIEELLSRLRWDLKGRTVAVIGASGDIGRACTMALAPHVGRMLLLARNKGKLDALRAELPASVEVTVSTDVRMATSASIVLAEQDLSPGTIVCDIGYPKNLSYVALPRPDVLVISGGVVQMPFELDMMFQTQLPRPDFMYGCFSEAMVLAISGRHESFSSGQGRISEERMREILGLARQHGFRPAPLYRGKQLVNDEVLGDFLRHSREAERSRG
jgi:fatty aldehyde-generating acyl-ACP reductase